MTSLNEKSFPHRLLTPGPVPLPPWVKERLALDILHHRSPEFKLIFKRVLERLKVFFQTKEEVLILNSTGTGAMEAALLNTLSPGDLVFSVVGGRFGERWYRMAERYDLNLFKFKVKHGECVNLRELKDFLIDFKKGKLFRENSHRDQGKPLKAILCQASETSTGTLFPIREIGELLLEIWGRRETKERPLFLVDAMTALGVIDLPMDDYFIDVLITSSQKALMIPPGLSFISLSKRAWECSKVSRFKKFYFDLQAERKAQRAFETSFSVNVSQIQALDVVLEKVSKDKKALQGMILDCKKKSKMTIQFLKSISIEMFSKSPSPAVTAFKLPDGIRSEDFKKHLKLKYNVSVASGEGGSLRIGHIGHVQLEDLVFCLEAVKESLKDFKFGRICKK